METGTEEAVRCSADAKEAALTARERGFLDNDLSLPYLRFNVVASVAPPGCITL
jgi:hypothetical protein